MPIQPPRLSIAAKLLLWCLALVAVFYAATLSLFWDLRDASSLAREVLAENYEADRVARRMIQQLDSLEDNLKRFEVLQKSVYMRYISEDLADFGETLEAALDAHPRYREAWAPLTEEYIITLKRGARPEDVFVPDATVARWRGILEQTLEENRAQMQRRLAELNDLGRRATRRGLASLAVAAALGVAGSLLMAWRWNRSLAAVRRGLRSVGRGGEPPEVRVSSRDELGQLARAYNSTARRLWREERMRSDFISMLSHEIRTPLTSIRESVDMLASGSLGPLEERQRKFLEISRQEALRLSGLLERLLTASRLEAGAPELEPAPCDAGDLARRAVDAAQARARARGVSLELRLPDAPLPVLADAGRIAQVLDNLLDNALRYGPEGGGVEVRVEREDGHAVFGVLDQGPGVPPAEAEMVFSKYYRARNPEAGAPDGSGLGLPIAKAIVEAHGGAMRLDREPGWGGVFRFTLPLASAMR